MRLVYSSKKTILLDPSFHSSICRHNNFPHIFITYEQISINRLLCVHNERTASGLCRIRPQLQAGQSSESESHLLFYPAIPYRWVALWDVPSNSYLLKDKGVDSVSGTPYSQIRSNKPHVSPYASSTESFEIVEDTFYYVGENEVAVYLFNTDMGTKTKSDDKLILFDDGWPNIGYQYWKNIEAVGFDSRDVSDVMLTHGHLANFPISLT